MSPFRSPAWFGQARSTVDLLSYAAHALSFTLEYYGDNGAIFLDIFIAFDGIWYKGLLANLLVFGLLHIFIIWIGSFPSNRSIEIRVDGLVSRPLSSNAGVLQGSIISSLLFIYFMNDLLSSTCGVFLALMVFI